MPSCRAAASAARHTFFRPGIAWRERFSGKGCIILKQEALCLSELAPGRSARVVALHTTGGMRRRLQDIGLVENTCVRCLGRSPGGDPSAYLIRGAVIAIRAADCRDILICPE